MRTIKLNPEKIYRLDVLNEKELNALHSFLINNFNHLKNINIEILRDSVLFQSKDDNLWKTTIKSHLEKSIRFSDGREIFVSDEVDKKSNLPDYYDNSEERGGSLYNVAIKRGWNAYLFDVVKRLERGGKKDDLELEITKSIGVLELWLKEQEVKNKSKKKFKIKKKKK